MLGILSMIMINVFVVGTLILPQLAMYRRTCPVGTGRQMLPWRLPWAVVEGCLFFGVFPQFVEGCCQCYELVQYCYNKRFF